MTVDRDTVSSFIKEDSASAEILKEMAAEAKNEDLAVSHPKGLDYAPPLHHSRARQLTCFYRAGLG